MRKEIIVAIIIGLILGLVIAYGIRSARISLENRHTQDQNKTAANINSDQAESAHTLFITSPEPNTITDQDKITIIGNTSPNSLISIISHTDQIATIADLTGNFTGILELEGGINSIDIKSYNNEGDKAETNFAIIYSTADFSATSSATNPQGNL